MATLFWAEGVWIGRWTREQQAWEKQIFRSAETETGERGPAGAVMCETRDLGIKYESGLLAGREHCASETSQDGPLEGAAKHGCCVAGANPGDAAKEDGRSVARTGTDM